MTVSSTEPICTSNMGLGFDSVNLHRLTSLSGSSLDAPTRHSSGTST